jgi:hypothetical protein
MIIAVPGETPCTSPLLETVAMPLLVDVHVTAGLGIVCPSESTTVTVSCRCAFTETVSLCGEIVTEPTGT